MMKLNLSRHQWLGAIVVVFVSAALSVWIAKARPPVQSKPVVDYVQHVKVAELQPEKVTIPIYTQGVIEPRTKIRLQAEVNGKILEASPKWQNGGFFRKGELLLKIEDYYYQNQLARAKASRAQAKSALTQEEGLSYVARQEWEKRNPDENNEAARALALREPQLAAMRAQYEAATADVVSAENALAKTAIVAPFDGVVVNKVVDIGQFASTGLALAELHAIDVVEIRIPLTEAQQDFLDLPGLNQTIKSPAAVRHVTQNETVVWKGYFVRTESVLDNLTRVLNGVVQINDPYGLNHKVAAPLRLGSFVEVEIMGKTLENIFVLPRRFLYAGNTVWLVDSNDKLVSRQVKVLPVRQESIYVHEGLEAGDRLVVSGLTDALEGVKVKAEVIALQDVREEQE